MGCAGEKQKLEDEILLMRLNRMEIQMNKELAMKKLADKGIAVKQGFIPDYIDPDFAQENNIYIDDEYMLNNRKTEKTDRIIKDNQSENLAAKKKSKSSKEIRAKTEMNEKKKKKKGKDKEKKKRKNSD